MSVEDRLEPEFDRTVGSRIEELRRRRRWSQRDLAAEAGVSRQYLGEIERGGKRNPGVAVLDRIARALGWMNYHVMIESEELEPPGGAGGVWPSRRADVVEPDAADEEVEPELEIEAIPIVGTATAGVGYGTATQIEDYVHVLKREARGRELRAVRVSGDCMMPVLYSGDVVIYEVAHQQEDVPTGSMCVVTVLDDTSEGDGGNVKYVDWMSKMARLRAEDSETPPRVLPRESVKVEGRVWRMIRDF